MKCIYSCWMENEEMSLYFYFISNCKHQFQYNKKGRKKEDEKKVQRKVIGGR